MYRYEIDIKKNDGERAALYDLIELETKSNPSRITLALRE